MEYIFSKMVKWFDLKSSTYSLKKLCFRLLVLTKKHVLPESWQPGSHSYPYTDIIAVLTFIWLYVANNLHLLYKGGVEAWPTWPGSHQTALHVTISEFHYILVAVVLCTLYGVWIPRHMHHFQCNNALKTLLELRQRFLSAIQWKTLLVFTCSVCYAITTKRKCTFFRNIFNVYFHLYNNIIQGSQYYY